MPAQNSEDLQNLLHQIHDLHLRPLAQVVTQALAILVKNGAMTKDEARFAVADAIRIITPTEWNADAKEDAAGVLQSMLQALDSI